MKFIWVRYRGDSPSPISALPPAHYYNAAPKCISRSTSYNRVWLAFHPYPQFIQTIFNLNWFGPPRSVTYASSWPWIDHPVSRLPPHTKRPFQTRFRYGYDSESLNLACEEQLVGSLSKRHAVISTRETPTACKHTVSGSISLPSEGVFSPFPHGTGSLSVTEEYLALRSGLRRFTQNFTCSVLLRILPAVSRFRLQGYHLLWLTFPGNSTIYSHTLWKSYNPSMHAYWFGLLPFRSPLLRESHSLSFPPVTEMFHFTGFAPLTWWRDMTLAGLPHSEIYGSKLYSSYP